MKRIVLLVVIALLVGAGVSAQDLSGLGRDFEVVVEQLGGSVLPNLEQSAIWGQNTGVATFSDQSKFFVAQSFGSVLMGTLPGTTGILGFVDNTSAYSVLNVPSLFNNIVNDLGNSTVTGLTNGLKAFFPLPIVRTSVGFALPAQTEAMIGIGGFPQLFTDLAGNLVAPLSTVELHMFHIDAKVRHAVLQDAGPFPAISIGAGYAYSGFGIGYDLASVGDSVTAGYGTLTTDLGTLNLRGKLGISSAVHSFGFDLQVSKAFGFFVPYVGLSPYYHFASVSGGVLPNANGDVFDAYVDYGDGGTVKDIVYTGSAPDTVLTDNNVSMVLFGGFDMIFGGFAMQVGSSWSVAKGTPGVALNFRWQ